MSSGIQPCINAILAEGGIRRTYTYADEAGYARQVLAYQFTDYNHGSFAFRDEYLPQLQSETALLLLEMLPYKPITIAELHRAAAEGQPLPKQPSATNLWLFLDSSLSFQLSLLDAFGYGSSTSVSELQVRECKELLRSIYLLLPFKLHLVGDSIVALSFTRKPTKATLDLFFEPLIGFMRCYNRLEFSPTTLRREIIRSGGLVT